MATIRKIRSEQVDEMVAALVMKWQKVPVGEIVGVLGTLGVDDEEVWLAEDGSVVPVSQWQPSTDRGQAMMVFEKCPHMILRHNHVGQLPKFWLSSRTWDWISYTDKLAEGICHLALRGKDVKVSDD